jgi:hypothetical protein
MVLGVRGVMRGARGTELVCHAVENMENMESVEGLAGCLREMLEDARLAADKKSST